MRKTKRGSYQAMSSRLNDNKILRFIVTVVAIFTLIMLFTVMVIQLGRGLTGIVIIVPSMTAMLLRLIWAVVNE